MTEVQALQNRSAEALASARYSLEGGFVTTAVNRAYYAAFYAARAPLLSLGEAPKTHICILFKQDDCMPTLPKP